MAEYVIITKLPRKQMALSKSYEIAALDEEHRYDVLPTHNGEHVIIKSDWEVQATWNAPYHCTEEGYIPNPEHRIRI